jgi:hypothetical protein
MEIKKLIIATTDPDMVLEVSIGHILADLLLPCEEDT